MDRNCSPNISSTSFTACARPPHCWYHRWTIWPRCANAPRPTWTVATCPFASALCEAFSVFSRVASKRTPRLADSARKRCWCETSLCSMSPETELLTRGWTMFASQMKLWCFHIFFCWFFNRSENVSDEHTKLVWTLTFYLIENTSKFCPDCTLLANAVISANNLLKSSTNLQIYLCLIWVSHRIMEVERFYGNLDNVENEQGLQRLVILSVGSETSHAFGVITPTLREKIEKIALDLVKVENEEFSLPALQLLVACLYIGKAFMLLKFIWKWKVFNKWKYCIKYKKHFCLCLCFCRKNSKSKVKIRVNKFLKKTKY